MSLSNRNTGIDFDFCKQFMNISVNLPAIEESVANLSARFGKGNNDQIASLLRAVTCIDLTTLCGDDTLCNVQRLCYKAKNPIHGDILKALDISPEKINVGAVCVYPAQIENCIKTFKCLESNIPIAAVAAGFPSGQYFIDSKLEEINACVKTGAKEIDIVISRDLVLRGEWEWLYEDVHAFREACGKDVTLKTIIAAGELGSLENVYRASIICMAAGADFIKTSTGKESVNATLPIGMTMVRAIKDYYKKTGFKVGFKPAGGIRTVRDVFLWQNLMKKELGSKWLYSNLFRIGASSLLFDIERNLFKYVFGYNAPKTAFPFQ